ncbi:hypothetical protein FE374_15555 [Georgenia yuyongxinii]|uniref:Uncharacterized protein n=1 Tax=Georgenia yuyongxinii TaxID=2589797 RepID=A0A5B8C9I6_9MICO|nr:hypothetical protein [Georgenia yuyongxinii]QDC25842.1 hypothetical protein FE374_15555 [Georgenia yuyongxinii]
MSGRATAGRLAAAGRLVPTPAGPAAPALTVVLALLGALVILLLGPTPAHPVSEPGPTPQPLPIGPGVPPAVADWFALEGPDAVVTQGAGQLAGLTVQQRADVEIGAVRTVMVWTPGLIERADLTPAAEPKTNPAEWAAPLVLDDTAVGVLFADEPDDGADPTAQITGAAELAEAMRGLDLADPLIHDVPLDGWFTVTDGEVRPLDPVARENLAGAAPLEVYQQFIKQRADQTPGSAEPGSGAPEPAPQGGPEPFVWVAVAVAVVLVWVGIVVWLRRPEEGSRAEQPPGRSARHRPGRGARR